MKSAGDKERPGSHWLHGFESGSQVHSLQHGCRLSLKQMSPASPYPLCTILFASTRRRAAEWETIGINIHWNDSCL